MRQQNWSTVHLMWASRKPGGAGGGGVGHPRGLTPRRPGPGSARGRGSPRSPGPCLGSTLTARGRGDSLFPPFFNVFCPLARRHNCYALSSRAAALQVQGVRRQRHLRAWAGAQHLQGVRRQWHLREHGRQRRQCKECCGSRMKLGCASVRARAAAQPVQRVRRQQLLRARAAARHDVCTL